MTGTITITNTHRGRAVDTFVVEVDGTIADHTDLALAEAAGYSTARYGFGYTIDRTSIDDDKATVRLWKD